jgi:hypothetical protein
MSKTLKAVFSPQKFTPSLIDHTEGFESLWKSKPAWVFSNMAHIAYFNEEKVKSFAQSLGANKTRFYDIGGAQAFLAVFESRAILAFRGSQPAEDEPDQVRPGLSDLFGRVDFPSLRFEPKTVQFLSNDVLADVKFRKVPFDDSRDVEVHRGFLGEINKIWNPISSDIKQHAGMVPTWVTGHSLGAAMATLAGMRHAFEGVVTFGEPRVGINIERAFKAREHIRYVNGDDPVAKVPPEKMFGYDHHGVEEKVSDPDGGTNFQYDHSIVYYSNNLA